MRRALVLGIVMAGAMSAAVPGHARRDGAEAPGGPGGIEQRRDRFGERRSETRGFDGNVEYDGRLVFVRMRFDTAFGPNAWRARGSNGEPPWAHDYPTADTHLMKIFQELTTATPRSDASNVFKFDEPDLFDYPIAYVSEPGYWTMSDAEVEGLRNYVKKGGFLIFDDFREADWYNLEDQMKRALPELRWVALEPGALVFNSFFEIKNFEFGAYGRPTYYGLFEDNDQKKRMLAIAGHNQDLGEYWEFSDTGLMPVDLSNEAYKFGVNYFIYGLTH